MSTCTKRLSNEQLLKKLRFGSKKTFMLTVSLWIFYDWIVRHQALANNRDKISTEELASSNEQALALSTDTLTSISIASDKNVVFNGNTVSSSVLIPPSAPVETLHNLRSTHDVQPSMPSVTPEKEDSLFLSLDKYDITLSHNNNMSPGKIMGRMYTNQTAVHSDEQMDQGQLVFSGQSTSDPFSLSNFPTGFPAGLKVLLLSILPLWVLVSADDSDTPEVLGSTVNSNQSDNSIPIITRNGEVNEGNPGDHPIQASETFSPDDNVSLVGYTWSSGSKETPLGLYEIGVNDAGNITWTFTLNNDSEAIQSLGMDEFIEDVANFSLSVQNGELAKPSITIRINGTNDAPVIDADSSSMSGEVTEDDNNPVSGSLVATDVDNGATLTWSLPEFDVTYGDLVIDQQTNTWTFTLKNDSSDVQSLGQNDNITLQGLARVTDENDASDQQFFKIIINGENDTPVIADDQNGLTGTIQEGDSGTSGITKQLQGSDIDGDQMTWELADKSGYTQGENSVTKTQNTTYGRFTFQNDQGGNATWQYLLNNDSNDIQSLADGDTVDDTVVVQLYDELYAYAEKTVTITIEGKNNTPVIDIGSSSMSGEVTEDDNNPVSGSLVATDVDNGATLTWSLPEFDVTYGDLVIDQQTNTWTFTLKNDSSDVQSLGQNDNITLQGLASVTDENGAYAQQNFNIIINGKNDTPVIDVNQSDLAVTIQEGDSGTSEITKQLQGSDIDGDQMTWELADKSGYTQGENSVTKTQNTTYGHFTFQNDQGGNATWQYVLNNDSTALQDLDDGETAEDTVVVQLYDEHGVYAEETVTITIEGKTNDTVDPILISTTPADNQDNVSVTPIVELNFSEPVTSDEGAIKIYQSNDLITPVESISANDNSKVFGFNTTQITIDINQLEYDTDYQIRIDANAFKDTANNFFAGIDDDSVSMQTIATSASTIDYTSSNITDVENRTVSYVDVNQIQPNNINGSNNDIVFVDNHNKKVIQLENDGDATFIPSEVIQSLSDPKGLSLTDINGDGLMDVVVADAATQSIYWYDPYYSWLQDPVSEREYDTNHILTSETPITGNWTLVVTDDIDRDGKTDDIISVDQDSNSVFWLKGSSHPVVDKMQFEKREIYVSHLEVNDIMVVDFDNSTKDVVFSLSDNTIMLSQGPESGTSWTTSTIINSTKGGTQLDHGDLDSDSDIDLIAASFNNNKVTWYENIGNEVFKHHDISTDMTGAKDITLSDLDGDNDLDAVVIMNTKLVGLINLGENSSGALEWDSIDLSTNIPTNANNVVSADFNDDDKQDIFVAGEGTDYLLLINNM